MPDLSSPVIHAASRTLPEHSAPQDELTAFFKEEGGWSSADHARLEALHVNAAVERRATAVPLGELAALGSFSRRNDVYIRCATELGERAIRAALANGGLTPQDIDHIFFVSVTGLSTPSIDARLVNRLGMRPDVKRTPVWGLGCAAGAAGIARAADYLRGFPDHTAILLAVELCMLTYQKEDVSVANMISTGLFGDGAAAVVLRGGDSRGGEGPRVVATRSCFYPHTEQIMGWEIVDTGFKIVLSPGVPELVQGHFGADVDAFLKRRGIARSSVRHWLLHPGGPRVLQAFVAALGLPEAALDRSRRSLAEVGNLSSASVLFVLADLLGSGDAKPGDYGLLAAVGPGFCSELVLLQW